MQNWREIKIFITTQGILLLNVYDDGGRVVDFRNHGTLYNSVFHVEYSGKYYIELGPGTDTKGYVWIHEYIDDSSFQYTTQLRGSTQSIYSLKLSKDRTLWFSVVEEPDGIEYLYRYDNPSLSGYYITPWKSFEYTASSDLVFYVKAVHTSVLPDEGPMGKGWVHNYETHMAFQEDGSIKVYWSTNQANEFEAQDEQTLFIYLMKKLCL